MNKEKWLLALISFVISLNAETISALGDNLVMNHDFSLPNILPLGVRQKTFAHSIPGWNCSSHCEIVNCDLNNLALQKLNNNMFSGDCPSQALDTSSLNIDVISQIFEA